MTLKPGDKVRLNDIGLRTCYGTTVGLASLKRKVMTVVEVEQMAPNVFAVEVDDEEVNAFLLFDRCFDRATRSDDSGQSIRQEHRGLKAA